MKIRSKNNLKKRSGAILTQVSGTLKMGRTLLMRKTLKKALVILNKKEMDLATLVISRKLLSPKINLQRLPLFSL